MKTKFHLILFLMIISFSLSGENMGLVIKYLGLNVVEVDMIDQDNELAISATSISLGKIAKKLNNYYRIKYKPEYIPVHYYKNVKQSDYQEDRDIYFFHDQNHAERISHIDSTRNRKYYIESGTRDFFSALFYLRFLPDLSSGSFRMDANQVQWLAEYKMIEIDSIRSIFGIKECMIVKITFKNEDGIESERSDMLTNNLVDEDVPLLFWISNDDRRIPLKAKFAMKPFPVIWKLISYED